MKNKVGRPRKNTKLRKKISFRVFESDYELLDKAHERLGLPKSLILRYVFNNSLLLDFYRETEKPNDPIWDELVFRILNN